jgi:hypothetical protein
MAITNGYATLAEVKGALRIPQADTLDDTLLETVIEAASREIDGYTERSFYNAGTAVRLFLPTDSFLTEIDDAISISKIESSTDGTIFNIDWDLSRDVQFEPLNGVVGGLDVPIQRLRAVGNYLFPIWHVKTPNAYEATVRVTGVWGWQSVPLAIKQATILYAARQYKRYDSPLGVAGFGDLTAINITRVDPDVMALCAPFRKVRMA